MSQVTANWIYLGDRIYDRTDVYGVDSVPLASAASTVVAAPFGGPILEVSPERVVRLYRACGSLLAEWRWNSGRIVGCGWSIQETAMFINEDGIVLEFDLHGKPLKTFSMGKEAKDLKVCAARVFNLKRSSGICVVTSAGRFFVVNNTNDPRVRKLADIDVDVVNDTNVAWTVLTDEGHAKILLARGTDFYILAQSGCTPVRLNTVISDRTKVVAMTVSFDGELLAALYSDGSVWMGSLHEQKSPVAKCEFSSPFPSKVQLLFCDSEAIIALSSSDSFLICSNGSVDRVFLGECVTAVQELDGARVFSFQGQEMFRPVPDFLKDTFSIGSLSPSALLYSAAEEFANKSHKANDYLGEIRDDLELAVETVVKCAGYLFSSPDLQKELLSAAQFGKSFLGRPCLPLADNFTRMCFALRILNSLRSADVGLPFTLNQYEFLTPKVIIDRLLNRRLYPLAQKVAEILKLPQVEGEFRVLAHWACYKVGSGNRDEDDLTVARLIQQKLGTHPQLSYSDIAKKAADCGRTKLAIKLLEHEVRVNKQVPLLLQLEQESTALVLALNSGDRDLAFSVISHLKSELSTADFHILIRKNPQGKVLYERFCGELGDYEALEDWFVQNDDFAAQAKQCLVAAASASGLTTRLNQLHKAKECWKAAKNDPFESLAEENIKLLQSQESLEKKLPGCRLIGLTSHDTILRLLDLDEVKLAEKLKSDMKMGDKRFTWLKITSLSRRKKTEELKKLAKQGKRLPLSMSNFVHIVKDNAGESYSKMLLTEEFVLQHNERFNLYVEFGMWVEAAQAAFQSKSLESLVSLETLAAGKDDALRAVAAFKAKLTSK